MVKEFDRNMFIMLLAIMIGVIIVTYFVADIMKNIEISKKEEQHKIELKTLKNENIQFTDHFLKSLSLLDSAREYRAYGGYHFDLAFLWYQNALSEKNSSTMNMYKNRVIDNCTLALPYYQWSHENFKLSKDSFNDTKNYTTYSKYQDLLNIYMNLSNSGAKITMLRYNATVYLRRLAENLTFYNDTVIYTENVTELIDLFNETMALYTQELSNFEDYQKEIHEYKFFNEIR